MIAELEIITASGPPPLTGPQVLKKLGFDFPELSTEELHILTAFLIESNGKTLHSAVRLTPTFKDNLIDLASKAHDQQFEIAIGELMAAVHIHLTLTMLQWDVSEAQRLFAENSSAETLCSNIQEHFCTPISSHLMRCLRKLSNGELLMKNIITLLQLLCQVPLEGKQSSLIALLREERNEVAFLKMIAQCLYIYRDVVTVYPDLVVSSLPSVGKVLLLVNVTSDLTPRSSMWLSLMASLSAAYAPGALKRSPISPSVFHFFKGYCFENLDSLVAVAKALLNGEQDTYRLQAVVGSLFHIGVLLVSRDRFGLFHNSLTEQEILGKLISAGLLANLYPFAFETEIGHSSQDMR